MTAKTNDKLARRAITLEIVESDEQTVGDAQNAAPESVDAPDKTVVVRKEHNEDEVITMSISSEEQALVFHPNLGYIYEEIPHDASVIDMSFMESGNAPFLLEHDTERQIGGVRSAWLSDRKGYASVSLSRSQEGRNLLDDMKRKIRNNISVGYESWGHTRLGTKDGLPVYRAGGAKFFEVSSVTFPADSTIGLNRSQLEGVKMENEKKVDIELIQRKAAEDERKRVQTIRSLADRYEMVDESNRFINEGKTVEAFNDYIREKLPEIIEREVAKRAAQVAEQSKIITPSMSGDLGLTKKEKKRYDFFRALRSIVEPHNRRLQKEAGFEWDVSDAMAQRMGVEPQGIVVPHAMLTRDITQGGEGADITDDDLRIQDFIDKLRAKSVLMGNGATVMGDLTGNVTIPRQTADATAYWVAENGAMTESDITFDQITLSPKTIGAHQDLSKMTLRQADMDVQKLVLDNFMKVIGLGIDAVGLLGGGANQPSGIMTQVSQLAGQMSATPTFAQIVELESNIDASNALEGELKYIVHPTMAGLLTTGTKDSGSGQFLLAGGVMNGYQTLKTTQIAANRVLFGNLSDVLIALWGGIDFVVDPYFNATSRLVRVLGHQFCDVNLRHLESFAWNDTVTVD